jgi:hypothetical protein
MSKVKEAIELALENVNGRASNAYGARIYTFEQVAMILQDILETANETEVAGDGTAVVTRDVMDDLVEKIEARIDSNINDMNDSDIIDEDSIEMSISGGRASVDNIDVDKDQIVSEAWYGIEDTIRQWAELNGIFSEN